MFRKNKNINPDEPVNVEHEAEKVYQYLKKQYKPIERKRRQIAFISNCGFTPSRDGLSEAVDSCYAISESYLNEIAEKDNGLKVLEAVKQKAKKQMKVIDHDYSKPSDAKNADKFVYDKVIYAIHQREYYLFLLSCIARRRA